MAGKQVTSASQVIILVEYMERHGDLSRPQMGSQGRALSDRLWSDCATTLNADGSGSARPPDKWKRVWSDLKTRVKKKAATINVHRGGTGGGPACALTLTPLEDRVLGLMGIRDRLGGTHGALETPIFPSSCTPQNNVVIEVLDAPTTSGQHESSDYNNVSWLSTRASAPETIVRAPETPVRASEPTRSPQRSPRRSPRIPPTPRSARTPRRSPRIPRRSPQIPRSTPTPRSARTPQRSHRVPGNLPSRVSGTRQTHFERAAEFVGQIELQRLELDRHREDNRRDEELRRQALESRLINVLERFATICEQGLVFRQN